MKNKNRGRRGITVSELMVVLAVLTIVIVMVVSFSTMVGSTSKLAKAKLDALNDIRLAESVIEGFIEDTSNNGVIVTVPTETMVSTTLSNQDGDSVWFDNQTGTLRIAYSDNGKNAEKSDVALDLEHVTDISFFRHGSTDTIYYCTITYLIGDSKFSYTFCVNPYAGEKIGGNS